MFRNRASSQKPADELYASFRQSFPELGPANTGARGSLPVTTALGDASLEVTAHPKVFEEDEQIKDQDPTPRGVLEPWRFTPSLMDPNSFAFASFANQPPGYYTPTPGGTNTLYHNTAGDLHTPTLGIGIGTPLSLPTSAGGLHPGSTVEFSTFQPPTTQAPTFHNPNPFATQELFAPSHFSQHPSAFETGPLPEEISPTMDDMCIDTDGQEQSPLIGYPPQVYDGTSLTAAADAISSSIEKFRFQVTLNAPTAMIRHPEEIPVTYLNKGQAYSVSIVDTAPLVSVPGPVRYRTYIRISFEEEQQRQRPGACWQLWKEGRGTNEAHQRGGRLQAVEYVDPNQGGDDPLRRPRVDLDSASFDGFAVTWTAVPGAPADCTVAVRFNFLSTDFSHSKGVKGIPVRLCAKTEVLSLGSPTPPPDNGLEVCYCKVKLFRDHGAERKLSNDVAHIKKTIDKLKQQIMQAEAGMKDFGKKKRAGSVVKPPLSTKPGKVPKHKRTWSISSASSTGGRTVEDDLHFKLAAMQDMFTSTRPVSLLYLKGEERDDPDKFPVQLSGENRELTKAEHASLQHEWDRRHSVATMGTGQSSSMVSPTPSSHSIQSQPARRASSYQASPLIQRENSNEWGNFHQMATKDLQSSNPQHLASPPDQLPVKIQKSQVEDSDMLTGWIEALGVDASYQAPSEPKVKPVACFYIKPKLAGKPFENDYYRAIYLMQRTAKDFVDTVASKCMIDSTKVARAIVVNPKGLQIMVDDDVIRELPEGQDMVIEVAELRSDRQPIKREWNSDANDTQMDGDLGSADNDVPSGFELKLIF
ncbi:hypothetical protein L228DRAFT_269369 [Xylona heveae TC161]|uniref:Grh/CP2 DB domain-containing protein n=1 Tax=Xylona heveae (strain CBS 132557 / TC161) TaxID=1328760 RepID=A0A165G9X1_XYLHT|nr:hypothetical protein L228DRAFT_269369 [Xylona heveae TC161]KZF21924.1 hypothetical protein L228DRAFT_269369 [Xylona heveae TC161]